MRYYCLSLLLALLVVTCLQSSVIGQYDKTPQECCSVFHGRRIYSASIKSYMMTKRNCPRPAVILITMTSRKFCVAPHLDWVKRIMNTLDEAYFNDMNKVTAPPPV